MKPRISNVELVVHIFSWGTINVKVLNLELLVVPRLGQRKIGFIDHSYYFSFTFAHVRHERLSQQRGQRPASTGGECRELIQQLLYMHARGGCNCCTDESPGLCTIYMVYFAAHLPSDSIFCGNIATLS